MFRLLQLSDLHISRYPNRVGMPDVLERLWQSNNLEADLAIARNFGLLGSHDPLLLDAVKAFASHMSTQLDRIVITGDVATSGAEDDLVAASNWMRELQRACGLPIAYMPGNHDAFNRGPEYFPGNDQFGRVFPAWQPTNCVQCLWANGQSDARVRVIAADFSLLPGDDGDRPLIGWLGRGRVRQVVVDELIAQTRAAKAGGYDVLWLFHFEPDAEDASLMLLDAESLHYAMMRPNEAMPLAVLCGHTHEPSRVKTFAGVPVFCCGSASQRADCGNWLNIIEVDGGAARMRPFKFDGEKFAEVLT